MKTTLLALAVTAAILLPCRDSRGQFKTDPTDPFDPKLDVYDAWSVDDLITLGKSDNAVERLQAARELGGPATRLRRL